MTGKPLGLQKKKKKISLALRKCNTHLSIHWNVSTIFPQISEFVFPRLLNILLVIKF